MASIEEAPPPNSPTPPTSVSAPNASPERNSSSSHPHHSHHHKSRRSHKPHVPKYPPKLTTTATTSPPTYELPRPKAVENKKVHLLFLYHTRLFYACIIETKIQERPRLAQGSIKPTRG